MELPLKPIVKLSQEAWDLQKATAEAVTPLVSGPASSLTCLSPTTVVTRSELQRLLCTMRSFFPYFPVTVEDHGGGEQRECC